MRTPHKSNYFETKEFHSQIMQSGVLERGTGGEAKYAQLRHIVDVELLSYLRFELVVRKPKALDGLAVPEVTLRRGREWAAPAARATRSRAAEPGVALVVLEEAPCSAAYRATLAPGASWALPADLAVFVLAGDVSEPGGTAVRPAGTMPRGGGVALRAGARGAALLLVGRPLRPSSRL